MSPEIKKIEFDVKNHVIERSYLNETKDRGTFLKLKKMNRIIIPSDN